MSKLAKVKPDIFKRRARVLAVFLFLFTGSIITRLSVLQIANGSYYKTLAENQYAFYQTLVPNRGEIKITDKESQAGYTVATNLKKPLVYAVPKEIANPEETAIKLSTALSMDVKDIIPKISDASRSYVPLKKQLTEDEVAKIKELKLTGIGFDSERFRVYPENTLLSQLLGFVGYKGSDRVGLYGLERSYEEELKGREGSLKQDKDVTGAWIFGGVRQVDQAEDGSTLILTIDRTVQFKAEAVLKATVEEHQADSGSMVILDPKTGAILGMAGFPTFNPNEYYKTEDPSVYLNKVTQSTYEPGSVFKAFTMAASLNEGKITPETTYTDTGSIEVDGYTIKNSDEKAHGVQNMTQVLEESLNTGVIFAKNQIGNQTFLKYIQAFGFGKTTGIEVPEQKGNLDNLKANIAVNFHTASFGQGISVTPVQLAQGYGAIANKGVLMQPHVIAAKIDSHGNTTTTEPISVSRVISEKTASEVTGMLTAVVENGHGKRAAVPGYFIAGKTGTAQVPRSDGKGYEENNNIGSFAGFGPIENPRFVIVVRINHPRTVKYAETTAAPAFGEMAQFLLNYYNIPPTRN